jgi:hypothetical protein
MIESVGEVRFDDLKIRREVEIARREERVMADVKDLGARVARALLPLDLAHVGQDRVAHRLEGARDEGGTDRPGRVAGTDRQHLPTPADRHRWGGQEVTHKIENIAHVVAEADARDHEIGYRAAFLRC